MLTKISPRMIIMAANTAGIAGSQVFRTQDAPLYLNAFTACLALNAVACVEIVAQSVWYYVSNKTLAKNGDAPVVKGDTQATPDGHREELVRKWWWTW